MTEAVFSDQVDGISDADWLALTRRAGGDGSYFFTENQLYLAYARHKVQVTRYIARRAGIGLAMIALGLATWVYALKADWGSTLVLGIFVTLSGVAMVGTGVVTRRDPAPREPLTRWLEKWTTAHRLEKLLGAPALAEAGLEYLPAKIACLIIVEREALVDLLLKNGAQRELSALIIAESGYPVALLPEARRLLAMNSPLKVIALHDATKAGVALPARLSKSAVFSLAERPLIDAGLFPADVLWLAELAPAIPASHTNQVPLDALSYRALLSGLRGVARGALSLVSGIEAEDEAGQAAPGSAHELQDPNAVRDPS